MQCVSRPRRTRNLVARCDRSSSSSGGGVDAFKTRHGQNAAAREVPSAASYSGRLPPPPPDADEDTDSSWVSSGGGVDAFKTRRRVVTAATRVLDTLRLRDWTPDAHYVGPVQTRGAYGAVTPTSARESGDGLASRERAREAAAFSRGWWCSRRQAAEADMVTARV